MAHTATYHISLLQSSLLCETNRHRYHYWPLILLAHSLFIILTPLPSLPPALLNMDTYPVLDEELSFIQCQLKADYPTESEYFTKDYIKCVASRPNSQNKTERRTIEYTVNKLSNILKFREESGASSVFDIIQETKVSPTPSSPGSSSPELLLNMANCFNTNSMYVHGSDKAGRKIIW